MQCWRNWRLNTNTRCQPHWAQYRGGSSWTSSIQRHIFRFTTTVMIAFVSLSISLQQYVDLNTAVNVFTHLVLGWLWNNQICKHKYDYYSYLCLHIWLIMDDRDGENGDESPIKVPSIVKCQIFNLQICSGWWGVPRGCRLPHCTHLCYRSRRHHHAKPWWISILSSRGEQIFIWIIHWPPVFQNTFQK